MKFTIGRKELVKLMSPVVTQKPSQHAHVRIIAAEGKLILQSHLTVTSMDLETVRNGEVTLNARQFREIIKTYKETPTLEFDASEEGLRINTFKMQGVRFATDRKLPPGF